MGSEQECRLRSGFDGSRVIVLRTQELYKALELSLALITARRISYFHFCHSASHLDQLGRLWHLNYELSHIHMVLSESES